MIQVADGALQIIDEKLIRMVELAEQASTGTYNTEQRLMINQEFQAMAAEIDRIALATRFNDTKLLCDDPTNKITSGKNVISGHSAAILSETASTMANPPVAILFPIPPLPFTNPNAVTRDTVLEFMVDRSRSISYTGDPSMQSWIPREFGGQPLTPAHQAAFDALETFTVTYTAPTSGIAGPSNWSVNPGANTANFSVAFGDDTYAVIGIDLNNDGNNDIGLWYTHPNYPNHPALVSDASVTFTRSYSLNILSGLQHYANLRVSMDATGENFEVDFDGNGTADMTISAPNTASDWTGRLGRYRAQIQGYVPDRTVWLDPRVKIHFGPNNNSAEDYYFIESRDCTTWGLGIDTTEVGVQSDAQAALETLRAAIVLKDKARAYFGATQNRLENTISNLQIQAENITAAESRISDVDVATEMTEFVRRQILAQTAVAVLAQANSIPRMALSLISA
jgi:flagellin-like hook-associated protein FlgL